MAPMVPIRLTWIRRAGFRVQVSYLSLIIPVGPRFHQPARMSDNRTLNLTTAALVVSNLVPLAGVLFFEWTVFEVLLLFWAENLVVGAVNVARYWTLYRERNHAMLLLFIPFFCLHFGGFALGHLVFLVFLFRPEDPNAWSLSALLVPLAALIASHVYSHYAHFIGRREYLHADPRQLMTQPYTRVIALHVAIVAGGLLVTWLGEPLLALAVLVLIKIAFDVPAHRREHRDKVEREQINRARASGQEVPRDSVFKGWGQDHSGSDQ
jgi:hypothetical protein